MAKDCKHYSPGELMDTGGRFVRIAECLYVRNGRIYGTKTVDGKMVRKAAPMQGLEAIDARGNPTAAVKKWVRLWGDQVERQEDFADRKRVRVPSFAEILEAYPQLAAVERAASGKPQEVTVSVASAALSFSPAKTREFSACVEITSSNKLEKAELPPLAIKVLVLM